MRISDWSSDVCSSDLHQRNLRALGGRVAVLVLGDNAGVEEFVVQIVAFAGAFTDAREHRRTTMALGDVVDQFLDEHGLADAREIGRASCRGSVCQYG